MKAKYKDKLVEIIELKSTSFVDYLQKQSKTVPLFSVDYICAVNKEYQIYRYVDVKANRVKYALQKCPSSEEIKKRIDKYNSGKIPL